MISGLKEPSTIRRDKFGITPRSTNSCRNFGSIPSIPRMTTFLPVFWNLLPLQDTAISDNDTTITAIMTVETYLFLNILPVF